MGTDIHVRVEVKKDGRWQSANNWIDVLEEERDEWGGRSCRIDYQNDPLYYSERDYRLFAALANVRNGYDIEPISYQRGIPADASPKVKRDAGLSLLYSYYHSPSWLLLSELQAYDWGSLNLAQAPWRKPWTGFLEQLAALGNPDDVRIVFWFDN